jgi:hypothetical protein
MEGNMIAMEETLSFLMIVLVAIHSIGLVATGLFVFSVFAEIIMADVDHRHLGK